MMNSRPTRKPENRGPFLKLRKMVAKVIGSKPFLIAASLLAAIMLERVGRVGWYADAAEGLCERGGQRDGRGDAQEPRLYRHG